MCVTRLIGIYAIIPSTILLTISFFVLLVLRKVDSQGLKAFAYVILALLWLSAAIILGSGLYTTVTGRHPLMNMRQMMGGRMQQMPIAQHNQMNR